MGCHRKHHFRIRTRLKMQKRFLQILVISCCIFFWNCNSSDDATEIIEETIPTNYRYLALGDSYTIGQSVCETCRFPAQLVDSLRLKANENDTFELEIIAQTGWNTSQLINAVAQNNPDPTFDLVTLLIGVNNQFQNKPFSLYETEFPILLQTAITLAKGNPQNVIVVSIPDYAFTPFGQGWGIPANTSTQLDNYNAFAQEYTESLNITFVNITDITRNGLQNPSLVASDNLHPSTEAYKLFVSRILPFATIKLGIE